MKRKGENYKNEQNAWKANFIRGTEAISNRADYMLQHVPPQHMFKADSARKLDRNTFLNWLHSLLVWKADVWHSTAMYRLVLWTI